VDLVAVHGATAPYYGFTTSPLLLAGVLVVQGGAKDAAVTGFDPATGKLLWSAGEDRIGYQSPVPLQAENGTLILAASNARLYGIEPASGKISWEYEHGGTGGRGAQSMVPVLADEGRIFLAHKDEGSTLVRLSVSDGVSTVEPVWEGRAIRNSYNIPVYHDGHIYAYSTRILTCVDAATGESRWRSRLPGDGFLILVDGHLVILTKSGELHVAEASPDGYREVGNLALFSQLSWSPPSFAAGSFYVRSLDELARVDLAVAEMTAPLLADGGPALAGSDLAGTLAAIAAAEDSSAAVDAFIGEITSFPLLEGPDLVHFIYSGPGEDLAVASDLFGARQERPMRRVPGTNLFTYSTRVERDARVNYMFMRDYDGMVDPRNQRTTTSFLLDKDMEMNFGGEGMEMSWFSMPDWQAPAYLQPAAAERAGSLEAGELESAALEETVSFTVYKPAGYDQGSELLPVAYIHGGQAAREQGMLPNSLDNLIGTSIRPILVVFIDSARPQAGETYLKMINEELIPLIDRTYRTLPEPAGRAQVGMGPAAFTALYCAMKQPGIADLAASQSSFLFGPTMSQMKEILAVPDQRDMTIYLDWSRYDLRNPQEAWDIGQMNRDLAALMAEHGLKTLGGEANDGIGWSSWRNRTGDLFVALFPLPGDVAPAGAF
jgi:enterochelin esterase-like enzyme